MVSSSRPAYVKLQSKKVSTDNLASFLTGGGGLSAFAIAMIAATNSMAGGTMVTAPGLTYAKGFSGGIIYYAGFLTAAFGLGAVGLKAAIMKQRIGAVSFLDLYRLRFRSKAVVSALAITCVVGLLFTTCGQLTAGAKMFAAITGSNQYYLGLLLVIVITVIYTSTGGVKSMAKVAAIQGVVMLIATFSIMGILLIDNAKLYGSLGAAVEYMGTTYPEMLPSGVAGIIFCGVFAAIQSSLAGYCMSAAAFFAKDFFIDCVKPDMPEKKQKTFSSVTILVFAAIATLLALKPTDLTQFMINFALGALASAWYWPVLCGLYWKKATWKGTFWSCIGGFFAYMLFYILSSVIPATKEWWIANTNNTHAFVFAWLISLILMVVVSLATQKDKVPLGYFQVFFCDDYDEKYAKNFRLSNKNQ